MDLFQSHNITIDEFVERLRAQMREGYRPTMVFFMREDQIAAIEEKRYTGTLVDCRIEERSMTPDLMMTVINALVQYHNAMRVNDATLRNRNSDQR